MLESLLRRITSFTSVIICGKVPERDKVLTSFMNLDKKVAACDKSCSREKAHET